MNHVRRRRRRLLALNLTAVFRFSALLLFVATQKACKTFIIVAIVMAHPLLYLYAYRQSESRNSIQFRHDMKSHFSPTIYLLHEFRHYHFATKLSTSYYSKRVTYEEVQSAVYRISNCVTRVRIRKSINT